MIEVSYKLLTANQKHLLSATDASPTALVVTAPSRLLPSRTNKDLDDGPQVGFGIVRPGRVPAAIPELVGGQS